MYLNLYLRFFWILTYVAKADRIVTVGTSFNAIGMTWTCLNKQIDVYEAIKDSLPIVEFHWKTVIFKKVVKNSVSVCQTVFKSLYR